MPGSNNQVQSISTPFKSLNFITVSSSTVSSGGTTTLTVSSANQQYVTGSMTHTFLMPIVSSLTLGQPWTFINNSTGSITIKSSGGFLICTILSGQTFVVVCQVITGIDATSWSINELPGTSGIAMTNTFNDNPVLILTYSSGYILNTYYPSLLLCNGGINTAYGPVTLNLGNIQVIGNFIYTGANTRTITAPQLIAVEGAFALTGINNSSWDFPLLQYLQNTFSLTNNNLTSFSFPSLFSTTGWILNSASCTSISFPSIQYIYGSISGTMSALTSVILPNLLILYTSWTLVTNALTTLSLPALTTIGFPLTSIAGNFTPVATSLATLSMPVLGTITGTFSPTLASLTSLTLTNLATISGAFGLTVATLITLNLPALATLGAGFSVTCASATTVTLSALATITGAVAVSFAALTTLSFPALLTSSSTFAITAANLVTFSFNAGLLNIGGNVTMTGMKLDQASVDGILVSLAALDGTGGTTTYSSKTVDLSGGTSSTPSATGLAAKATLVARSCTVTTN